MVARLTGKRPARGLGFAVERVQDQIARIRDDADRFCRNYDDKLALYRATAYHNIAADMERTLLMELVRAQDAEQDELPNPNPQPMPRVVAFPAPAPPTMPTVIPTEGTVEVPVSYDTQPPAPPVPEEP